MTRSIFPLTLILLLWLGCNNSPKVCYFETSITGNSGEVTTWSLYSTGNTQSSSSPNIQTTLRGNDFTSESGMNAQMLIVLGNYPTTTGQTVSCVPVEAKFYVDGTLEEVRTFSMGVSGDLMNQTNCPQGISVTENFIVP